MTFFPHFLYCIHLFGVCILQEEKSVWYNVVSFVFSFSTQSQSPVTTKTLPAQTESAFPPDSAVMETTTAWIIQMRSVCRMFLLSFYNSKKVGALS